MLERRTLLALPLALAAMSALVRSAGGSELAPDIERIRKRGRLIVAMAGFDVPPFVMSLPDGTVAGHDVDLAQGIAKALGVSLELDRRASTFNDLVDIIAGHEADLAISKVSETLDRAMRVRFSRPYLVLRHALLLNRLRFAQIAKGRDPIEVVKTYDASLAVMSGTAYVEYARRLLPRAQLHEYASWDLAVEAVLSGEVVAAYRDELEVQRTLAARPDAPLQLRMAVLTDTRDPIAVALPWDSGQLCSWIDLYIESMTKPLTVDELLAKYAHPAAAKRETE